VDNSVFSKLFDISGGNPLYVYELTKGISDKFRSENNVNLNANANATNNNESLTDLMNSFLFKVNRVEEVILFRFDQLDAFNQLSLKIASVACRNGASFSTNLLKFVLKNSNLESQKLNLYSNDTNNDNNDDAKFDSILVQSLDFLLNKSDFIKIASSSNSVRSRNSSMSSTFSSISSSSVFYAKNEVVDEVENDADAMENRDNNKFLILEEGLEEGEENAIDKKINAVVRTQVEKLLLMKSFEFKITLEQFTIYDMMLADQKESLHKKIAEFLRMQSGFSEIIDNNYKNNINSNNNTSSNAVNNNTNTEAESSKSPGASNKSTSVMANRKTSFSANSLFEEGYHWSCARVWPQAMCCYYRSAMQLESVGSYLDHFHHLTLAYQMFLERKFECGIPSNHCNELGLDLKHLFSNNEEKSNNNVNDNNDNNSKDHNNKTSSNGSLVNEKGRVFTKQDLFVTFYGNASYLETALQVLLKLGQSTFSLLNKPLFTSSLYEEALQIIYLTGNIMHTKNTSSTKKVQNDNIDYATKNNDKTNENENKNDSNEEGEEFGLKDPTICFPILSGIAALYRNGKLEDDANKTKESEVVELFLNLATSNTFYTNNTNTTTYNDDNDDDDDENYVENIVVSSSNGNVTFENNNNNKIENNVDNDDNNDKHKNVKYNKKRKNVLENKTYKPHYIVSICLKQRLLFELNKVLESTVLADTILKHYDYFEHSKTLVKFYGNDRVPYTLASNFQTLALLGDIKKVLKYHTFIEKNLLPNLEHMHSLAILVFPLSFTEVFLRMYKSACETFKFYFNAMVENGGYSFFSPVNPIYMRWFELVFKYQSHFDDLYDSGNSGYIEFSEKHKNFDVLNKNQLQNNNNNNKNNNNNNAFCDVKFLYTVSNKKTKIDLTDESEDNDEDDEVVKDIVNLKFLLNKTTDNNNNSSNSRSMLYDSMDSFGLSVEYVCADFCFLKHEIYYEKYLLLLKVDGDKANINDDGDDDNKKNVGNNNINNNDNNNNNNNDKALKYLKKSQQYLESAYEYINFAIECHVTISKVIFCHFMCLLLRSKILMKKSKNLFPLLNTTANIDDLKNVNKNNVTEFLNENNNLNKTSDFFQLAKNDLVKCVQVGTDFDYIKISFIAGLYLQNFNIDEKLGKDVQLNTIKKIKQNYLSNNKKDFAVLFQKLCIIFPTVEQFYFDVFET
jgi:hypothetical protein